MGNGEGRKFDLEERTTDFAKRVIVMCKSLSRNTINNSLVSQIVRSAGSIGANYREANDSLGTKDFYHKIKISRKEAKETLHWLELIESANAEIKDRLENLKQENKELIFIFSAIARKQNN